MTTKSGPYDEAVRDVLIRVRALLTEPEQWTRDAFARTGRKRSIWVKSPHACCWCLAGAIKREAPDLATEYRVRDILETLLEKDASTDEELYGEEVYIEVWNDAPGRTHAEVLALLDRAIASLEAATHA